MVVQFGLAMIPFGHLATSPGLISGTTSGTSGSIRNAEELSITTAPAAAAAGANSSEMPPPALKRARSMPEKESGLSSFTACSRSRKRSVLPTERAEAKRLNSPICKSLCSKHLSISSPTAPVAPTMAIWGVLVMINRLARARARRSLAGIVRDSTAGGGNCTGLAWESRCY